jgi:hypothetical protein
MSEHTVDHNDSVQNRVMSEGLEGLCIIEPPVPKLSLLALEFMKNAVNPDLRTVPGLGPSGIAKLKLHGIEITDHLIGKLFSCNRDEERFCRYLVEDIGLLPHQAKETAMRLSLKVSGI